jgi:hypothetical protein
MKKIIILLFLSVWSLSLPAVASPLLTKDFQYCTSIEGPTTANMLYQIHLSNEVLEKSNAGFEDVRLFDPLNREIPYALIENISSGDAGEIYPMEITGYTLNAASAVITMRLPEKYRAISTIDLSTSARDFKKRAVLSSSKDGKTWQVLTDAVIYDFSSQVDLRKTKIDFNATDHRYYQLKLTDTTPSNGANPSIRLKYEGLDFSVNGSGKKELRIDAVRGKSSTPKEQTPIYDSRDFADPPRATDKDGNTVIILKAGLPVDKISIDVTNSYYYRSVTLYASDTGREDSYQLQTRSSIYQFPLSAERREVKNSIECRTPKHKYYKIVIENKNNPPLMIQRVSLSWIQKNLFFIALSDAERYSLCFGNPELLRPDYDLAHFVNSTIVLQSPVRQLPATAVKENSGYVPPIPGGQRARIEMTVLKIVVVILVLGIGFWLYALIKKIPRKKDV